MSATRVHGAIRGRVPAGDVDLFVDVVGIGHPILLMHGGPSADLWTMQAFRRLQDEFTLVFYDHRCNGRSTGVPVSTMTWENLTADAEALRERLGHEQWAVLGHSFGGHVALEYALRHPDRVSHLVLLDTGADGRWARTAADRLAEGGEDPAKVELVRRWFTGEFDRREYLPMIMRLGDLYAADSGWKLLLHEVLHGGWRSRMRPEAFIFAGRELMEGWSVMDRLAEITAPTLVMAGTEDFVFPPECQRQLAAGIPGARLDLVAHAGHNPADEQTDRVIASVREFLAA